MKISVLMSLYAREQPAYLRQCLHSLQTQTRPADEIVLVLDGKIGADLHAVIDEFISLLPLKIIPLAQNVGLGQALNIGLTHCSYDYVFRMDSDDVAVPQRFAWQCAFWKQHADVVLLGGQIAEFDESPEHCQSTRRVPLHHDDIAQFAKKRNPFNHMTVAFRKNAIQMVDGYQHFWAMEDYHLWLRLLANGARMANLPDVLVYARTGVAMLQRRRGWQYVMQEWRLAHLKHRLRIQAALPALYYAVLRSLPRILPAFALRIIYQLTRKI